jgi:hypothetical protein
MAVAFLLVLLALGPGMFWILYGVAKSLLEKGSVESAVSVLAVADKHPYTQFVQKHWEQRSQQRLAELHLSVARAYARKGARFKATGMLNQARELLSDPRAFDELEAQFLQSQLYDDARNGVSNETLWESAKPWLVIQLRRGAATYSQSVQSIAEMLQNGGFNHDVWREFATSTLANSSKLTNQDSSMCREMLARTYLEDTGAPARYESGPTTAILGYVESARLADLNAQQSGSPDLMQRCRTRFVDLGVVVMSRYFKEAKEDVTNHSPDAARQAWANALKITQGCLMIADDFRVRSLDLAWQLKTLGESSVAAQPELADLSFSCVLTILTNVEGPQDKIQEVAYASMFLAMDQVKPDLDKLRREELLNGAVRLWLDHQPAPDATAGQLESTLSEMIRKGRITQAEADHFAVGWRVPLQVFNKYLETGEVDKAADTLAGLLNDKTFPDDRMRRSIIRLADKARHWVPSSTPRLANLPEEAIQQLHDKAAGMSLAEEKQILAVLLVRSKLSQLSQLPIEKATQTDRLRLAGEAAKLWNESPSVAVDLRISMGETIADLLDKGCLAIETVPQFNVGHYIAKALQTKYQEKDFTRAIDLLSRCIAQPGVVTAPEAHDLIVAIFNASVETFGRQRLDVGTVIAREAGIKKLSDAARDTEMSSKINKLMEHLDLVKDMVLVRKNGCFFFIDRQGVSVDQYHKFDKALPTEDPAFKSFYSGNMNISPVVMVTQTQAAAFAKASGKRLPRLSELECLSESLAELPAEKMNVDHGPMSKTKILAPGAFPDDNVAGVIDLAGNVREWCADVNADRKVAVFGNSWFAKQKKEWWKDADCWISPAEKDSHTGFRCVAEVLPDGLGLSVPQGSSTTEPTQP